MASMVQFAQTVNRVNSVASLLPSANAEPLTQDSIVLMAGSRLRSLDDQIKTNLNKQEAYRACTSNTNAVQKLFAAGVLGDGYHDPKDLATVTKALDEAVNSAPEGQVKEDLKALRSDFQAKGSFTKDECSQFATRTQDIAKGINSSAELDMITVNSLMSQKQTAVQLFNNMLTAQGEALKSIAASIGK